LQTCKGRYNKKMNKELPKKIAKNLLSATVGGTVGILFAVTVGAIVNGCTGVKETKTPVAAVTQKAVKKPVKKELSKAAAERLYEKGLKDLLWAIDDPDGGYLALVESPTQRDNPDIYSQVQAETWHFVENNYGALPESKKSDLKSEGLKHLDCRMERSCSPAPAFNG
jgi:hypothetical protein